MSVTEVKQIDVWRPKTDYALGDYFFVLYLNPVTRRIGFDLMSKSEYPGSNPAEKDSLDAKMLDESQMQQAMQSAKGVVLHGLKEVSLPGHGGVYDDPELDVKDALPYLEWLIDKTQDGKELENIYWAIGVLKKYGFSNPTQVRVKKSA